MTTPTVHDNLHVTTKLNDAAREHGNGVWFSLQQHLLMVRTIFVSYIVPCSANMVVKPSGGGGGVAVGIRAHMIYGICWPWIVAVVEAESVGAAVSKEQFRVCSGVAGLCERG